jgi:transposase
MPGSYETVKLFVRPLRAARLAAARVPVRFETPPGQQSQIDGGVARVPFGRATHRETWRARPVPRLTS